MGNWSFTAGVVVADVGMCCGSRTKLLSVVIWNVWSAHYDSRVI
jgi:hypothetical protein